MDEIHIALPTRPRDPERHSRWKKRYQFGLQPLLNTVSSSSSAKLLKRVAPVAAVGAQTAPVAAAVAAVLTWLVVSLSGLEPSY